MSGLVVTRQQFVITLGNMLPDATIPWIEMVYDLTVKAGLLLLDKKALGIICHKIHVNLNMLAYEKRHGDLNQALTPILQEVNQLLEILEGAEK